MIRQVLIWMLLASAASAQPEAESESAQQSLEELRSMVTPNNFDKMGFESPDEVARARLGRPMPIIFVPLDELRGFHFGDPLDNLLQDVGRVVFPITVDGHVRTSVTISRKSHGWRATGFGPPKLMVALDDARSAVHPPATEFFAVHVAALGTYFLGYKSSGQVMLVPLVDDAEAQLIAGRPRPAAAVFAALAPIAERSNQLPN